MQIGIRGRVLRGVSLSHLAGRLTLEGRRLEPDGAGELNTFLKEERLIS